MNENTHLDSKININLGDGWKNLQIEGLEIFVKGIAILGDQFCNEDVLEKFMVSHFDKKSSDHEFRSMLEQLNGFFAIVIRSASKIMAAVDQSRNHPLFYGEVNGRLYISDDAYWVTENLEDRHFDELSEAEFALTGYVTGSDTLYPNLKQLQSGEFLVAQPTKSEVEVSTQCYYRYFHSEDQNKFMNEGDIRLQLSETLHRVFDRLVHWADGRPLFIPLSGGNDSRLICQMLKKLDYDNLVAYSYGVPGNQEAVVSKQVASQLGIKWEFVPYSHSSWRQWFNSVERKDYYRFADGLCSLAHMQDWPAVWEMKKRKSLPQDCIFVPGHTVTLVMKGYPTRSNPKSLVNSILKKHYSLWPHQMFSKQILQRLQMKIWSLLDDLPRSSPKWAINACESWEIRERQQKFIGNSVRVYEYFGYQWYLPLKDMEFIRFWCDVPLEWRQQKKIYRQLTTQLHDELFNQRIKYVSPRFASVKNSIRETPIGPFSQKVHQSVQSVINRRKEYKNHPLAWYGAIPENQFKKLYSGRENFTSFCALERIGRISFENQR